MNLLIFCNMPRLFVLLSGILGNSLNCLPLLKPSCALFFSLGVITAADILDRETTGSYWLTVYATDRGVVPLYSTIEVYIEVEDVNDNAPLTSEPIYYPVVMENSPKDVSVIQIQAEDPDSGSNEKLTYRITSGNPQNFFAINIKTGKGMFG